MTEQNSQNIANLRKFSVPDRWLAVAAMIAFLVLVPILSVLWIAATPSDGIWGHLWRTTLPRYLENTFVLAACVALIAGISGAVTAWMVTMYRFAGSRYLQWLLLLPLAVPAYVSAYALVDFLEYAGPIQTGLRATFGFETSRDYWFPEIRSRGAAVLVLSMALAPYVFLLARAAFSEQSGATFETARALGAGPVARFWRVGLPLARPAIVAGCAIVAMETVSDFGVVSYFAVQTLTTGIFSVWLEGGSAAGASQIASLVLLIVLLLVGLERHSRRNLRFHNASRAHRPIVPENLVGMRGWAVLALCSLPFLIGFLLPILVISSHAFTNLDQWLDPQLLRSFLNTLFVGGIAALVTVLAALVLVYGFRINRKRNPALLAITTIGYAAPGAVLGIGLLFPLSYVDHALADVIEFVTGVNTGLLLTGTAFAIIYAYCVRFFAIAQGATESAFQRVAPSVAMASRSLGKTAGGTLRHVYMPMMRGSVATALLLVFVDCVKELPATLLLRPFNFNTLSTRVYEKASLEQIGQAAPAAVLVVLVGFLAILLLAREQKAGS